MTRVVFGLPAYESADTLPETLESLLSQRYEDLAVIVVDDASGDGTAAVVERYAAIDPRVWLVAGEQRLGMAANWRRAFAEARARHPEMELFAWASDHDLWHPRWVARLVEALETNPRAVLAYPRNVRISASNEALKPPTQKVGGRLVARPAWTFDTAGERSSGRRMRLAVRRMSAGNMVYGLWRADALERAGVFEPVLAPDRLVVTAGAILGEFVQVPETLWYRRYRVGVTTERQRGTLFAHGSGWRAHVPWPVSHSLALALRFGLRGAGRPEISRARGLRLALAHAAIGGPYWLWRKLAHAGRVARKRLLRVLRAPRPVLAALGRRG